MTFVQMQYDLSIKQLQSYRSGKFEAIETFLCQVGLIKESYVLTHIFKME